MSFTTIIKAEEITLVMDSAFFIFIRQLSKDNCCCPLRACGLKMKDALATTGLKVTLSEGPIRRPRDDYVRRTICAWRKQDLFGGLLVDESHNL